MNIYLACTVRGDRGGLDTARALSARLQQDGHRVLTTHLLADEVEASEAALTEREVYERDVQWLDACDLLVAEASGSSYGVGFEVGYVLGRSAVSGQRVLLLYDEARQAKLSRLMLGNTHTHCAAFAYRGVEDLLAFVDAQMGRLQGGRPG